VLAAVVLAAGASTRFGSPKQRLLLGPVLERVRASSVDRILVVLGAHEVETDAETVRCPSWQRGPGASLGCGLAALAPETEAAVVLLADGPDLNPAAIERVVAHWRASGRDVVAATYGGRRGHPVLLARAAWERVPDEGARTLDALPVPCDDLGAPGDVDVRADLPSRFRGTAAEVSRLDESQHGASPAGDRPPSAADVTAPEGPATEEADAGRGSQTI
jgi:CTP:molybdopterin cytidylyltransferase MocA